MIRRGLLLAAAAAALTAPPAWAQTAPPAPTPGGGAFAPIPPAQQTPPPTQTTPTPSRSVGSSTTDSKPSVIGTFGLFGAGVLVIFLIGWFIMRDARRSLPKRHAKRRAKGKKAEPAKATATAATGRRPPPRPPRKASSSAARRNKRRSKRRAR